MMKASISRGGGFRGAVAYVLDKGQAECVGGNMSGATVPELTKEFGITKKLRPETKNPVWHCSLALPEGDRLSAQKWDEISADFMRDMGMDPSNYLYTVQRHSDTEFDHAHIVASRIGLDAQLWHGQHDVLRAIEATQKLEKKHQLTLTAGFDPAHKKDRKSLTAQEINMSIRTEMKPPRMVCQEAIDAVLQSGCVISATDFITRLEAFGVRAVPSVASTGTMNGFSFECEGIPFTGSKLGESFKWVKLQTRGVDYVQNRDFEALADAKRLASKRIASERGTGDNSTKVGRDSGTGQESGSVTRASSHAGNGNLETAGSNSANAAENFAGVGGGRPNSESPTRDDGSAGAGFGHTGDGIDGAKNAGAGHDDQSVGSRGQGLEIKHSERREELQEVVGAAGRADGNGKELVATDAQRSQVADDSGARSQAARNVDAGHPAGSLSAGRASGGGWASRFKQNSAAKRDAAASSVRGNALESGNAPRARVVENDRVAARTIDPTTYLESMGFEVKREGRHLSVRQHGDEVYRCTLKPDGHWVTCDKYENGVGDNIALVAELEPGTGFAESVYRLSGAPSVSSVIRPASAPVMRKPPTMPAQSTDDVQRGREYLLGRGIGVETTQEAERAGMLRYSAGAVLFVGVDEQGMAQNIMRRSVDASEAVQKRDLRGTDKQHPQMLRGSPEIVLVVEGGIDALAAWDIARREKRPLPTVLVSGGANVKGFMQTPWVQKILRAAKKVIVAFEREKSPEVQAKTDAAHELQIQRLREVCAAQVTGWQMPEGSKDLAELNAQQVQQIERLKQDWRNAAAAGRGSAPQPR